MKKILTIVLLGIFVSSGFVIAQSQSAEDVAMSFIEARNTWNHELAASLFADDPVIQDSRVGKPADYEEFYGYQSSLDWRWQADNCNTSIQDDISTVTCDFKVANLLTDAVDIGWVPEGKFIFEIKDGKIQAFTNRYPLHIWAPNVFSRFRQFVIFNHDDDFDKMFVERFPLGVSEEGQTLFTKHALGFAEVMTEARANPELNASEQVANDFLTARGNWDATALGALLADEVESYDVQRSDSPEDYKNLLAWYEALNWNWTPQNCHELGNDDGVAKIQCMVELQNDWTGEKSYLMPWGFRVNEAKITGVYPEWNRDFVNTHFVAFRTYIEDNYPSDFDVMFYQGGPNIAKGEEAMSLFRSYTTEFLASREQSQSPAEELARAYIAARNAYDIETTKTLLAEDVRIIELGDDYSITNVEAFLAYAKMQDMRWEVESCTTNDEASGEVVCAYAVANSISDALEIDPITGGTFSFEITEGKISKVVLDLPIDIWGPNVFSMMIGFIRANHSDDFPKLLPPNFPNGITEEGLGLWRSYTDEFVEVMGAARANPTTPTEQIGFDFLTARGNWDAEAMAALMADKVESFDVSRSKNLEDYTTVFAWFESLNWNWEAKSCDDIGFSDGVSKILCVAELSNDVTRGLGNGSYNMGWGLEINDDKIIGIYPEWNRSFVGNNLTPLKQYILKNHNTEYQKMYQPQDNNLVRGEENLELLKTFVAEFLASQPSTPTEQVGLAFFEAMDTWNAEAVVTLLADEVKSFDVAGANDLEEYKVVFAWYESLNMNWKAKSCEDLEHNDGVSRIKCVVEISNDISRSLGNKSYEMDWRFSIENDKIIYNSPAWNSEFSINYLVSLKNYIRENNRDDFDKMYTSQGLNLVRGEENLELLKTYVAEFIASQE